MSPELKQFYVDLQAWIDAGFPVNKPFSEGNSICRNLAFYLRSGNYESKFYEENTRLFLNFGLSAAYPFNSEALQYSTESQMGNVYKNPARLAWIKKQASEGEES